MYISKSKRTLDKNRRNGENSSSVHTTQTAIEEAEGEGEKEEEEAGAAAAGEGIIIIIVEIKWKINKIGFEFRRPMLSAGVCCLCAPLASMYVCYRRRRVVIVDGDVLCAHIVTFVHTHTHISIHFAAIHRGNVGVLCQYNRYTQHHKSYIFYPIQPY